MEPLKTKGPGIPNEFLSSVQELIDAAYQNGRVQGRQEALREIEEGLYRQLSEVHGAFEEAQRKLGSVRLSADLLVVSDGQMLAVQCKRYDGRDGRLGVSEAAILDVFRHDSGPHTSSEVHRRAQSLGHRLSAEAINKELRRNEGAKYVRDERKRWTLLNSGAAVAVDDHPKQDAHPPNDTGTSAEDSSSAQRDHAA